jgi:hypothetical protein
MPRFAIEIDPNDDEPTVAQLAALADAADATFTDIALAPTPDRAFGIRVEFVATDADVAAYCAFYDVDPDIDIERL